MKCKIPLMLVLLTSITLLGQWKKPSNVTFSWNYASLMDVVDSNKVVIMVRPSVETHNGFLYSDDRGKNWKQIDYSFGSSNENYRFNSISMLKNGSIWAAYDGKIYANTSNNPFSGKWELQFSDTNLTKYILYVKMFDTMKGIAMGECKDMYSPAIFLQTTNGGTNWVRTDKSRFIGGLLSACDPVIKFFDENLGFAFMFKFSSPNTAGGDSLYKTTNGGRDWKAIKTPFTIGSLRVFSENKIVNWGKEITITTDGGTTWKNYSTPVTTSCLDYWLDEKNSSNIWVLGKGTYKGLYFSNNSGSSFSIKGSSPNGSLRKMKIINNKVGFILGDSGDFLVTDDIQYYTTGLNEHDKSVPTEYSLQQNYPNPFNPSTKISYQIPQAGFVTLKIYDLIGREVETLVNEFQQAGEYNSQFQILNSQLSSGVYFCTLKAGSFVQTKKMVFLK